QQHQLSECHGPLSGSDGCGRALCAHRSGRHACRCLHAVELHHGLCDRRFRPRARPHAYRHGHRPETRRGACDGGTLPFLHGSPGGATRGEPRDPLAAQRGPAPRASARRCRRDEKPGECADRTSPGRFRKRVQLEFGHSCTFAGHVLARAAMAARLHDLAQARALLDEGLAAGTTDPGEVGEVRYYMEAAAGDWGAALRDASRIRYTVKSGYRGAHFMARIEATYTTPLLAVAQAHVGDFAASHRSIEGTPADCVPCETARGDIDALERNYGGAAYWFGRAVHDAPSIPFADADWGQMLTARGDLDGAIAKFDA